MGKHSGGGRISRPISGASVGGTIIPNNSQRITRSNWNSFTNANILAAERNIRVNDYETAFAFDGDGNLLEMNVGGRDSVAIDPPKNSIVTHNHPRNSSFSRQDIETSITSDVAEIRAVGRTHTYSLKRPKGGWGSVGDFKSAYEVAERRTRTKLREWVNRGDEISDREFSKRASAATRAHYHIIMADVARQLGWEYRYETK